jgi:hypothetical protein
VQNQPVDKSAVDSPRTPSEPRRNVSRREADGSLPAYAWPGGYPLYHLSSHGYVYCAGCASQEHADPRITHAEINDEDVDLYCDGCGALIASAYGER